MRAGQGSGKEGSGSVCPECGCRELVRDPETGELACRGCGVVVSETELDRGPDWRAFTLDEKRNLPRAGSPLTLMMYDRDLSTTFNPRETGSGKPEQRQKLWRLKKWDIHSKLQASDARNLSKALTELNNLGDRLSLPGNVVETAARIYRQALQEDVIRGRTIKKVAAACLYMACRQCRVIRRLDEISQKTRTYAKDLARIYRLLFWKLDVDVPKTETAGIISRIVSKLGLHGETERLASLILEGAEESRLTGGKHPGGIAASCIYISTRITGERVTQDEVSTEAEVTSVTIRNRYKELMEELDITIPL